MELKVFKLANGSLQFVGVREVRTGDAILEGDTSMAEVNEGRIVSLREDVNRSILETLTGEKREAFERGLQRIGLTPPTLRESFKRLYPNVSDRFLDILTSGKAPRENEGSWIL